MKINILISVNRNYIKPAAVLIRSILLNSKREICVYIIHDELENHDKKALELYFDEFGNQLTIEYLYIQNSSMFKPIQTLDAKRWPVTVYYRLLIKDLLPQALDRILYLDADMLVNGDIATLYELDFHGNMYACCEDTVVSNYVEYNNRLDIPKTEVYYNSGMILFNLNYSRTVPVVEEIVAIQRKYSQQLMFPDQDILNVMIQGKIKHIDYRKYNFVCSYKRESEKKLKIHAKNAVIFHYAGGGRNRPWEKEYVGNYFDLYWKYATAVFGEQRYMELKPKDKILKPYFRLKDRIETFLVYHMNRNK